MKETNAEWNWNMSLSKGQKLEIWWNTENLNDALFLSTEIKCKLNSVHLWCKWELYSMRNIYFLRAHLFTIRYFQFHHFSISCQESMGEGSEGWGIHPFEINNRPRMNSWPRMNHSNDTNSTKENSEYNISNTYLWSDFWRVGERFEIPIPF